MILLAPIEVMNAVKSIDDEWQGHTDDYAIHEAIAQAQLKKVAEWAEKPCPHGTKAADTSRAFTRECDLCWQALPKEIE